MSRVLVFAKRWMLPICMVAGALAYILYACTPALKPYGPGIYTALTKIQPPLLFAMLFLSFCKIEPGQLRPHRWHLWMLIAQGVIFMTLALFVVFVPGLGTGTKILLESAMLCFIGPTATAAAVITDKLGGSIAGIVTYTIFINLLVAVLVPLMFPLVHPIEGETFWMAFWIILRKVFPLLILPALLAFAVRYLTPGLHRWIVQFKDLAFYIWAFSLTIAIAITARQIYHSECSLAVLFGIGLISLLSCVIQFKAGHAIGRRYGDIVTPGQSFGQKNTVFMIWMGYTFLSPVTSVAGGLYCIWHNLYNSWQLYRQGK